MYISYLKITIIYFNYYFFDAYFNKLYIFNFFFDMGVLECL